MTEESIILVFEDGILPISSSNKIFKEVKDCLESGQKERACEIADVQTQIELRSGGDFRVQDGMIMVGGVFMPQVLGNRVVTFIKKKVDHRPLMRFWENLHQNPSEKSQHQLFSFLEHNGIPITDDGCFIAYKRTDENDMDTHTHTNKHIPGVPISMDRDLVDPDPNEPCSTGLHVAAHNYADKHYPNGHLWEVKVNPKDVVAVPNDYNGEKMRTCGYTPIRRCGGMREEPLYEDDGLLDNNFLERGSDGDSDGDGDYDYDSVDIEGSLLTDMAEVAIKGQESTEEADADSICRTTLNVGNDGRAVVSASLLFTLGVGVGDKVFAIAFPESRKIIIEKEHVPGMDRAVHEYTVDKYRNVKLSKSILVEAVLTNLQVLNAVGSDTSIRIHG